MVLLSEIIKLENVNYKLGDKKILESINLSVVKGQFISVIGPNGSGKSTLAKLLNGILAASSGEVTIDGLSTNKEENLFEIRKKVGMIFQNPDNQIIASTVEEEIAFGLENLCTKREDMNRIIKESLEMVGLGGFEKRLTHTLSGGQKQRLNIASVIAMKPEILVLDEPTSMLDPMGKNEILKLILKLNHDCKITVILITHFMREAIFSDKVFLMIDGKMKNSGTPEEVFGDESCMEYISPMQSAEILFFLKKLGYEVSSGAFESEKCAGEIIKILNRSLKNDQS